MFWLCLMVSVCLSVTKQEVFMFCRVQIDTHILKFPRMQHSVVVVNNKQENKLEVRNKNARGHVFSLKA